VCPCSQLHEHWVVHFAIAIVIRLLL
jgi:hypothetical protein